MHILFVTGEYPPLAGGVGAYTAELRRALLAKGVQVSVLTDQRVGVAPIADDAIHAAVERWDWRIWPQVAGWAQRLAVDWVHVQYQTAAFAMHPAINLAPWWWRRQGYRVAWTYHDLLVPYLFPKAGSHLRHWITERPAHTSDRVIVTNEGDRLALAQSMAGRGANLAKIPIGSNIEGRALSMAERNWRRARRGYTETDLVIAYFGFLNRSKGGMTLIETLDQLVHTGRNAHLLMIGERVGASDPTNYQYLQTVEARLAQLGLTDRVQWTGHQAEAEVSADLAASDILLMPYTDGASLRRGTLMAGLVHGCAIVTTTPQSPLPELVAGRDLLYVPPDDAAAAAQAVAWLADDPALIATLRTNALARSRLFAWPKIAEQHCRLYAEEVGD